MGPITDDITPSTEISPQITAFEEWFRRFSEECKGLCRQNITSLYKNNQLMKNLALMQFDTYFEEVVRVALSSLDSLKLKNIPEQKRESFLKNQRVILEEFIFKNTKEFVTCLQKLQQIKSMTIWIGDSKLPKDAISAAAKDFLQKKERLAVFFIKEMLTKFKDMSKRLDLEDVPLTKLNSMTAKMSSVHKEILKNFSEQCEHLCKVNLEKPLTPTPQDILKDKIKTMVARLKGFDTDFSKYTFWKMFSPRIKQYRHKTGKIETLENALQQQENLSNFFKKCFITEKMLMLLALKNGGYSGWLNNIENWAGTTKGNKPFASDEWIWLSTGLTQILSKKMAEGTEPVAKFLDDKTFHSHINKALNALFEELLPQALLKKPL